MLVQPVAGQSAGSSATARSHASASKGKKAAGNKKAAPSSTKKSSSRTRTSAKKLAAKSRKSSRRHKPTSRASRATRAARAARTARLRIGFVASAELRPMAQQLANLRTPAAYAGVTAYARKHTGDAAAAAYLALGHAYLLDKRYVEAEANLRQSSQDGQDLADYAEFLRAQALHSSGDDAAAEALLRGFTDRYPDSIFDDEVPELEANILLALNNAAGAARVLAKAAGLAAEDRTGFQLALGQTQFALGQKDAAARTFKQLLLAHPLSQDAQVARARLTEMGVEATLTLAELRGLADAYYKGGRYEQAADQYRALLLMPSLSTTDRNGFAVAAAACDYKLKRLTTAQAQGLADTPDENGARRLYLLMELARGRDDTAAQQSIVTEMESRFPTSPWLAEALFSSGNMYLLKRDYPNAVQYYAYLAAHFPDSKNAAAAHWRAGWLSYRQGLYADATRLFDEQIRLYPTAPETVGALYWRGRLLRDAGPRSSQGRSQLSRHRPSLPALLLRANGAPEAGSARRHADCGCFPPRSTAARPAASAGRKLSDRKPTSGQGQAAGQCRTNRVHRAGDCRGPGLVVLEHAGRGTNLCVLW